MANADQRRYEPAVHGPGCYDPDLGLACGFPRKHPHGFTDDPFVGCAECDHISGKHIMMGRGVIGRPETAETYRACETCGCTAL
jgi:hypothetical protein